MEEIPAPSNQIYRKQDTRRSEKQALEPKTLQEGPELKQFQQYRQTPAFLDFRDQAG